MKKTISPGEAELLATVPPSSDDAEFLRQRYDSMSFVRVPLFDRMRDKPEVWFSPEEVEERKSWTQEGRAAKHLASLPTEIQEKITLEKLIAVYEEHESTELRLFGDQIQKTKKWVIFILPRHA